MHRSQLAWEEGRVLAEVMQHCRGNGAYPVEGRSCRRCLRPVFYRNKCLFKLLLNLERAEYSETVSRFLFMFPPDPPARSTPNSANARLPTRLAPGVLLMNPHAAVCLVLLKPGGGRALFPLFVYLKLALQFVPQFKKKSLISSLKMFL